MKIPCLAYKKRSINVRWPVLTIRTPPNQVTASSSFSLTQPTLKLPSRLLKNRRHQSTSRP